MRKTVRHGFTLIEMLIVLVVMTILGALALPKLRAAASDADTGMRTVQIALQQAQRAAVMHEMEVGVSFDTARKRVRTFYDANGNHQLDTGEQVYWANLPPGDHFTIPPSGVQMSATAAVVGNSLSSRDNYPTVFFHRDGGLSSELEIYLTSQRADKIDIRAIHVREATGRVQIYRFNGATWLGAGL